MALRDNVKRIAYVYQANVTEYMTFIAKLQDPEFSLPIIDVRHPDAHDDLLSEAERLLHNVLTAMSTRICQERAFMRKYFSDDTKLTAEYGHQVTAAFRGDPQVTFLQDLRNHITHHQLPVAQSRQTFSAESMSMTLTLPCAPLLKWRWSSGVKKWITGCGEAVEIAEVVRAYAQKAGGCDKWLFDRIGLKYATEIQEFLQAQEEYARDFDAAFGSPPAQ
jgi:hypothetical protein